MAFRFKCSALANVSLISLVNDFLKWLPPVGMARFVLDDIRYLLALDRWQLDKAGQAALPGNGDRYSLARQIVARNELLQRLADQLVTIGFRLRENLGVLDIIECFDDQPVVLFF